MTDPGKLFAMLTLIAVVPMVALCPAATLVRGRADGRRREGMSGRARRS